MSTHHIHSYIYYSIENCQIGPPHTCTPHTPIVLHTAATLHSIYLPQWTPSSKQLAQILHIGGLLDQTIHLLLHREILRIIEISTRQFGLNAINYLQSSAAIKTLPTN